MAIVCDCGHVSTPDGCAAGYARDASGKTLCYTCADAKQREDMKTATAVFLYLKDREITTWSGGKMATVTARVTRKRRMPRTGAPYTIVYFNATDLDGKHWYGTSPGDHMYARLRAKKAS